MLSIIEVTRWDDFIFNFHNFAKNQKTIYISVELDAMTEIYLNDLVFQC